MKCHSCFRSYDENEFVKKGQLSDIKYKFCKECRTKFVKKDPIEINEFCIFCGKIKDEKQYVLKNDEIIHVSCLLEHKNDVVKNDIYTSPKTGKKLKIINDLKFNSWKVIN